MAVHITGCTDTHAGCAGIGLGAGITIVALGPILSHRVGALTSAWIAHTGVVAFVERRADDGSMPTQLPATHLSVWVQPSPSSHGTISSQRVGALAVAGSQVPHNALVDAVQMTGRCHAAAGGAGVALVHGWHRRRCASSLAGVEHSPWQGRSAAPWHWSMAVQTTVSVPVQLPPTHESLCVQTLSSLHGVPSAA